MANIFLRGEKASILTVAEKLREQLAVWELQGLKTKEAYEKPFEKLKQELRLAQRGLTSGCGCPIGQCLNHANSVMAGECWLQWAASKALADWLTRSMDKMWSDGNHPRRFGALRDGTRKDIPDLALPSKVPPDR